jgi:hypothetical protein
MYRDLLVHVDGSEAGRRRLQFAFDLTLRTGARLSGLHLIASEIIAFAKATYPNEPYKSQ